MNMSSHLKQFSDALEEGSSQTDVHWWTLTTSDLGYFICFEEKNDSCSQAINWKFAWDEGTECHGVPLLWLQGPYSAISTATCTIKTPCLTPGTCLSWSRAPLTIWHKVASTSCWLFSVVHVFSQSTGSRAVPPLLTYGFSAQFLSLQSEQPWKQRR